MASQTQGIHQLLQAEKQAKDKLAEAKRRTWMNLETIILSKLTQEQKMKYCIFSLIGKGKQLKQAKEEAVVETDQYRMQTDKEFRLKQLRIMGFQSNHSDETEEQTPGKIRELNGHDSKCMERVMKQLLNMVCDMKPEIHVNYRATK
uniref:V-type proton ATPase subunit G 3 isoform X2 n=1 Tax=Callithrix jacchus TaxID=9483 RepID=UPI0023DD1E89|nr:V-type proton ATPase subunit G 3 isoform X2 [Callithrix jacchus]